DQRGGRKPAVTDPDLRAQLHHQEDAMKGRQSRYVTGGESFAEIARLPSGAVVRLCLNTGLEDALREASKSLKSAFTRSGRKCRLSAGTAQGPFTGRRQGVATHLLALLQS
ncbi:hypothetical protein, partial [Escherichia coli]